MLLVPVSWQSQCSAFDCAGCRRVSDNVPSITAVRRLWEEGEGAHSSPLLDYDQQERCSIQPRCEYRIRKCVGTLSNAVEVFLLSVLLPQATIQLLHSPSYQPAPLLLPSRANTEAQ